MKKKILVGAAILVVLAAVILTGVLVVTRYLVGGEKRARDKWEIETGTYTFTDDEINVQMYRQPVEASRWPRSCPANTSRRVLHTTMKRCSSGWPRA